MSSNTITGLAFDLFPIINDLLTPRFAAIGEGSASSGTGTTTLSSADYPDALLRDGSRSLLGNLAVATGKTIDGVDISELNIAYVSLLSGFDLHDAATATSAHLTVGAHDHLTAANGGLLDHNTALSNLTSGDPHTQYASANGVGTRLAFRANGVSKNVTGGLGLTNTGGITLLTGDVTLNIGAGDGMTINADDIAVNSTVVRTTRTIASASGVTGGGDLSANRTLSLDQAFAPVWTGAHTFQNTMVARSITPQLSDTYDLGTSSLIWRKGWLSELDAVLFAQNTITLIGGWFRIGKGEGVFGFDVSAVATTINFEQVMTVSDFVEIRAALQIEYIQIGTLVAGTTYNVTRNLDGSGANAWVAGTVYSIRGNIGNGYIDLNGFDTPRIQIFTQGATYNAQTEQIRLGDLNGNWGYVAATYGMALGEYGANKPNITIDSTNGLRIRNNTTDLLTFDVAGSAKIAGVLNIGTAGGIFQGTGPFASPTTGLKLYSSGGVGLLEGYSAGVKQAGFNATGEIESGAGVVKLNASGITIKTNNLLTYEDLRSYQFVKSDGVTKIGGFFGMADASWNELGVRSKPGTGNKSAVTMSAEAIVGGGSTYAIVDARNDSGVPIVGLKAIGDGGKIVLGASLLGSATNTALQHGTSDFPLLPSTRDLYFRTDFRAWFNYDGSAWKQTSVCHFTSTFPALPLTNMRIFREDWRALLVYDGTTWQQIGSTTWNGAFPASPPDNLRVFRGDRDLEYFWNSATSEWLTTTIFDAVAGDTRILAPYTTTNIGTTDTIVSIAHIDTRSYAVRIINGYFFWAVGATNTAANYWTYRVDVASNGGATTDILSVTSTAAVAANASGVTATTNSLVAQNALAARSAIYLVRVGAPTALTFRGIISYRMVG